MDHLAYDLEGLAARQVRPRRTKSEEAHRHPRGKRASLAAINRIPLVKSHNVTKTALIFKKSVEDELITVQ
ncbi:hypothetical protein KH172YL63_19040 [Bacillus sp. KH172YL63]|nr:hypothetical protein KH172YL63_19040 [Bacillus sp. KH172YL63]